jgi:hypothetical protein
MQEDCAHLTPEGYRFFRPRQEAFYLILSEQGGAAPHPLEPPLASRE